MFEAPSGKTYSTRASHVCQVGTYPRLLATRRDFGGVVHSLPTIVPADARLRPLDPMLIVMSGLPATGKSAIADAVAPAIDGIVLSVDPIESALLTSGINSGQPTGLAAYAVAAAIAETNLRLDRTVIIDAVNGVGEAKTWWIDLARREDVRLLVVETICSDEALHRRRLAERQRSLAIGEPSWATVTVRRDEWVAWPFAPLTVDAAEPLAENLDRVVAAVEAQPRSRRTMKRPKEPRFRSLQL